MKLADSFKGWSRGLSHREHIIIVTSIILIVLTSVMLVFEPTWRNYQQLRKKLAELEVDATWLNEQAKTVKKFGNNCAGRSIKNSSDSEILNLILRRNQLRPKVNKESRGSHFLEFEANNANKILKLMSHLACDQFALEKLSIERVQINENLGRYGAKMQLRRVR